jgi:hypothetical protein
MWGGQDKQQKQFRRVGISTTSRIVPKHITPKPNADLCEASLYELLSEGWVLRKHRGDRREDLRRFGRDELMGRKNDWELRPARKVNAHRKPGTIRNILQQLDCVPHRQASTGIPGESPCQWGLEVAQNGRRNVAEGLLDDSRPGQVVGRQALEEGNYNRIQRADLPLEHLDDAADRQRPNTALSYEAFEDLVEMETDQSKPRIGPSMSTRGRSSSLGMGPPPWETASSSLE